MQTLPNLTEEDEYAQLPEAIKQYYTRQEFLWMGDERRARIVEENTEPEWEE